MNTVVYYPHIYPSTDWLKLAALCWNHVYRLVPEDWDDSFVTDLEVEKLDKELGGILRPINAQSVASSRLEENFINWVEKHKKKFKIEKLYQYYNDEVPFFSGKVNQRVIESLEKEGFRRKGPFLLLPKYIAHYYLSLCASEAAKQFDSDAVTNERKFTDIIFETSPLYSAVATAVIQAYLPENLITLEPERIKDFRESINKEKLKYQTEIQLIVDKYRNTSSVQELETVKQQIIAIAIDEVEKVKNNFKRSNQKLVLKSISVSLAPPAIAAFIASALHIGIIEPAGIVLALSLFAASAYIDWNEAKSAKSDSPWSYVLNIAQI